MSTAAWADATASGEAAALAYAALAEDDGAADILGNALAAIANRPPLADHAARLKTLAVELGDAAAELRAAGESLADDPERLAAVRGRRQLLRELQRKYGETLADVIAYGASAREQLG